MSMRYFVTDAGSGYGARVWVEEDKDSCSSDNIVLKTVSIWGGSDKKGLNYRSYEVSNDVRKIIPLIMSRLGYREVWFQLEQTHLHRD